MRDIKNNLPYIYPAVSVIYGFRSKNKTVWDFNMIFMGSITFLTSEKNICALILVSKRCLAVMVILDFQYKNTIFIEGRVRYIVPQGPSLPWSYGSWIYNYQCNQCLSPLMLWVRISIRARCTTLYDKICQRLATGRWFSPGPPVSSTNKTDRQ